MRLCLLTVTSADADARVSELGALLESRVDELARGVVASVRTGVAFYRDNDVVTDEDLFETAVGHLTVLFQSLQHNRTFDTGPADETGRKRAAAGIPMPAVMDAFRVGSHRAWTSMREFAADHPEISGPALLGATKRFWEGQDQYTEAMTTAYHEQAAQQVIDDAAERAALTEALLGGRPLGDHSLWDVAALLRIPARGPYVVVAATVPHVGRQALPQIAARLRTIDVFSAWRLLPDIQIGIVQIPSADALTRTIELLRRLTSTRAGVSPVFSDLADTARYLRYARVAMDSPTARDHSVGVFDDSVLGVAAVSAPEVTRKIAEVTLGSFQRLPEDERHSLLETFAAWLDHDGSPQGAADALFCHPNTVRNRLRRIEEHTGKSLSIPRELAELCLAFEVAARLGDQRSPLN